MSDPEHSDFITEIYSLKKVGAHPTSASLTPNPHLLSLNTEHTHLQWAQPIYHLEIRVAKLAAVFLFDISAFRNVNSNFLPIENYVGYGVLL